MDISILPLYFFASSIAGSTEKLNERIRGLSQFGKDY